MMTEEFLQNKGMYILNKPLVSPSNKTVVVLGTARGGTSMVASVLQSLGVYMGNNLGPVYEDPELSNAIESKDEEQIFRVVNERNKAHAVWGWKRPSAIDYFDVWDGKFTNPYIIAIFRDAFAIANRNRISMLTDVFKNMKNTLKHQNKILKYLEKEKCPIILCSYEKILRDPKNFVTTLNNFIELNALDKFNDALDQINPESSIYIEHSRITHSLGHLGVANQNVCSGWVFYPDEPKRTANVEIYVNDKFVKLVRAEQLRPDVKEKVKHHNGQCGFIFHWPEEDRPSIGDKINVKAEGDNVSLSGSPKIISETNE